MPTSDAKSQHQDLEDPSACGDVVAVNSVLRGTDRRQPCEQHHDA